MEHAKTADPSHGRSFILSGAIGRPEPRARLS